MASPLSPTLNVLSLCSGVGMLDEGLHAGLDYLGIRSRVLAYVERESYAAATLLARMEEESLEPAPVWCGDLEVLDCTLFAGRVDCVVAGFPCQPWSVAGAKAGTDDARWIWPAIMAIVRAVGAPLVVLENVPGLVSGGGLDPVLGDLAEAGLDAEWLSLAAADVRANHRRERVFILAVEPERGRRILRQSSRRNGFADGSDAAMEDAARLSGGQRAGRQRILESGSGLVDTDRERHERGKSASHHRTEAGGGARRADAQRRRGELADGVSEGRRPEAHADQAGHDGMEQQDSARRGECGGDAERRLEFGCQRVADAASQRLPQRRCQPGDIGEEFATVERGGAPLADTGCPSDQRRGRAGVVLCPPGTPEGEGHQRERHGLAAGDGGEDLAVTDGAGFQRGGQRHDEVGRQEPHGYAGLGERELFAPGPGDLRWADIIARRPDLAPAIEPGLCVLADGVARPLDESRADQLRCGGNGVVALQAAVATVELVRRVTK